MNVVILAGGLGTRLSEETDTRPKPIVEVGGQPILWHIMKHYAPTASGSSSSPLGYKGDSIKRYFAEYSALNGDLTVDIGNRAWWSRSGEPADDWLVHLIDTGDTTGHRWPRHGACARMARAARRSWRRTATAYPTSISRALLDVPSVTRADRDRHRRPSSGPVRRPDLRW